MELDRILDELALYTGEFPREAVEEAVKAKEEITPKLLEILENTIKNARNGSSNPDDMGHIYALYLLSQFREKRTYPLFVEMFSLPEETIEFLLGDSLTEDGPRMLASVCDGNTELMRSLVENEQAYDFSRGAALEGILIFEINRDSREQVIEYFQGLFRRLPRQYDCIWDDLAICCNLVYPEELYDDLKQAYEDGLIDPMWIGLKDIERTLKKTKEEALEELKNSKRFSLIENTVAEMEWWSTFQPKHQAELKPEEPAVSSRSLTPLPANVPIRKEKKIGRNQPCPCGSGKKYKKCCGRNQ